MLASSDGAEVSDVASILNNLASLYKEKEWYALAEPLYQRALSLHRTRWASPILASRSV
jgi:hypothetical protein